MAIPCGTEVLWGEPEGEVEPANDLLVAEVYMMVSFSRLRRLTGSL